MNTHMNNSRLRRTSRYGHQKNDSVNQSVTRPIASSLRRTPTTPSTENQVAQSRSQSTNRRASMSRSLHSQSSVSQSPERNLVVRNYRPFTLEGQIQILQRKLLIAESKIDVLNQMNEMAEKKRASDDIKIALLETKTELLESKLTEMTDELALKTKQCEELLKGKNRGNVTSIGAAQQKPKN